MSERDSWTVHGPNRSIRLEPHGLRLVKGNDQAAFQNIPLGGLEQGLLP